MNYQESKVPERVNAAKDALSVALLNIDSIQRKDRTEEVNTLLSEAADCIYEAKQLLEKVNTSQYSNFFNGERVKPNPCYVRHNRRVEKVCSVSPEGVKQ